MKIQCLLIRALGTQVLLGETTYDFQPDENGVHVAEVTEQEHIDILINQEPTVYVEAYKPKPVEVKKTPVKDAVLKGLDWEGADIVKDGETITFAQVVKLAHINSGLTVEEWNALTDDDVMSNLDKQFDFMGGTVANQPQEDVNQNESAPETLTPPPVDNAFVAEGAEQFKESAPTGQEPAELTAEEAAAAKEAATYAKIAATKAAKKAAAEAGK